MSASLPRNIGHFIWRVWFTLTLSSLSFTLLVEWKLGCKHLAANQTSGLFMALLSFTKGKWHPFPLPLSICREQRSDASSKEKKITIKRDKFREQIKKVWCNDVAMRCWTEELAKNMKKGEGLRAFCALMWCRRCWKNVYWWYDVMTCPTQKNNKNKPVISCCANFTLWL